MKATACSSPQGRHRPRRRSARGIAWRWPACRTIIAGSAPTSSATAILTRWTTGHSQRIGYALTVDLGHVAAPCAIALALGEFRRNYARRPLVDTTPDGVDRTAPTSIRTAPLTIRAAVEDPRMVSIAIAVTPAPSRFIRLRIAEPAPDAWVVSEITVTGVRRPG